MPPDQRSEDDYLRKLEGLYQNIFPGRAFHDSEFLPRADSPTEYDSHFLLRDEGGELYDIAEMSGGEQSVFPILYDFVRQQIANSVVLIDEVDLNLHPPAAQHLMKQLIKFEPSCQFIITTHSEAVSSIASPYEISPYLWRFPMSVTQLYCEGTSGGIDPRVIAAIAPQGCQVKPVGSKRGLLDKVRADRGIVHSLAGLVDRDFDCQTKPVQEKKYSAIRRR